MPYVGDSLTQLCRLEPIDRALERMVNKGGDRMVEWAVKNTPIGAPNLAAHSFKGGNLRTSWYQRLVKRTRSRGFPAWESGVATDVDYAPDVEYGTGLWGPEHRKYTIVPKNPGGWLHWIDPKTGKDVFAKRVEHPGSPGQHMVAIAVQMVEHEIEVGLFDEILRGWAREAEELARV